MKRSLITDKGIVSFVGGITTKGEITLPRPTLDKNKEIYRECVTRSKFGSFIRSL